MEIKHLVSASESVRGRGVELLDMFQLADMCKCQSVLLRRLQL
jgi:hypothetical protein